MNEQNTRTRALKHAIVKVQSIVIQLHDHMETEIKGSIKESRKTK